MTVRSRLDDELVRRGLARSREQAAELIAAGRVAVTGQTAAKAATQVSRDAPVTVAADYKVRSTSRAVGRAAGRCALRRRRPDGGGEAVPGRGRVDRRVHRRAAARGAAHVVAVDVGTDSAPGACAPTRGSPSWTGSTSAPRPGPGGPAARRRRGCLSFISLTLVLPALVACAAPDADFALMVKPEFEVGKGRVGAGGVVRDPADRAAAVRAVADAAASLGRGVRDVTASPVRDQRET